MLPLNYFDEDSEFTEKVKQVEYAIYNKTNPERIYAGSSGSYFAKNIQLV
jgi:hypothetical protein